MQKDIDILEVLRHHDKLPAILRNMDNEIRTIWQIIARAEDEIDKLRKENKELKKQLKKFDDFQNAVIETAGGEDQVEDFKFFAPDMKNPDELLKAATQMLNGKGEELREC
jgi:predicted translin family RNA/ssDNA-binding protein